MSARLFLAAGVVSFALMGAGCASSPPAMTQAGAEALADRALPADPWRAVSKWLALPNGNVWLLTRQRGSMGEPPQPNPCGAVSTCPVESWVVNPETGAAHLSSSQNEYLSRVDASAEAGDDGFLRVDWDILAGDVSTRNLDRTEYVNEEDGSIR